LRDSDQERATLSIHEKAGLGAERREQVARIVRERRVVRVDELSAEFGVSAATVRRDLAELEAQGRLRRVYGGAVAVESSLAEPGFDDKTLLATAEKRAIAEAALRLVKPDDSVFLDGGSTVLSLARLLTEWERLTVVTNSLRVASVLSGQGPRMILVGGEFRRRSQTIVGAMTRLVIEPLHVDTAFMGAIGVSVPQGLTTTDPREAQTKALVMRNATQVVLLADSSKIGKVSFLEFGALQDVDVLVTDKGMRKTDEAAFKKKGLNVIKV
jgi:DeoR family transcriptional regulator, fructose operon transcriptional repressor